MHRWWLLKMGLNAAVGSKVMQWVLMKSCIHNNMCLTVDSWFDENKKSWSFLNLSKWFVWVGLSTGRITMIDLLTLRKCSPKLTQKAIFFLCKRRTTCIMRQMMWDTAVWLIVTIDDHKFLFLVYIHTHINTHIRTHKHLRTHRQLFALLSLTNVYTPIHIHATHTDR